MTQSSGTIFVTGFALVQAAWAPGVAQAGHQRGFPGWDSGRRWYKYWTDKWDFEEAVHNASFAQLCAVVSGDRARRIIAAIPNAQGPITMPQAGRHLMLDRPLALASVPRALLA